MTAKQVFEHTLIELSKVKAPSLLLEDFNYLFNKAINNYINRRYGLYDTSLQTTDDLRVLKSTAILTPKVTSLYDRAGLTADSDWATSYLDDDGNQILNNLYGNINEVELPKDYLHLLNCICIFKAKKPFKCYNQGSYVQFPAIRLDSDKWAQIINDYYNKPCYKRPYYFIHNVNTSEELSTNPIKYKEILDSITYTFELLDVTSGTAGVLSFKLDCINKTLNKIIYTINLNGTIQTPSYNLNISGISDLYTTEYDTLYAYAPTGSDGMTLTISTTEPESSIVLYKLTKHNKVIEQGDLIQGTDIAGEFSSEDGEIVNPNFPRTINISGFDDEQSTIEKTTGIRLANPSNVRMEIRYGKDSRTFELYKVFVDYIKAPQHIRLTPELMDLVEDTSQVMEFPDYVCQEITNELVMLVMENTADPRLQTNMAVNLSIAQPGQQLQAQAATSA